VTELPGALFELLETHRCSARFSIAHAQFVWDIKTEPKYVELFERIWGTDKLAGG
jgi:hypothetical protein